MIPRGKMPRFLAFFCILTLAFAFVGCGEDDEPGDEEFNMSGEWIGSYQSNERPLSGEASLVFVHEDNQLSGQASMTGAPCISSVRFVGTIENNQFVINLIDDQDENKAFQFNGVVYPDTRTLEATYFVENWGVCTGSSGTAEAEYVGE